MSASIRFLSLPCPADARFPSDGSGFTKEAPIQAAKKAIDDFLEIGVNNLKTYKGLCKKANGKLKPNLPTDTWNVGAFNATLVSNGERRRRARHGREQAHERRRV